MNRTFRIVLGAAVAIVIAILFGYVTGTLDPWLTKAGYGQWALKGGETSGETAQAPTEPGVTEVPASSEPATKPGETVVPIFDLVRVEPTGDAVIAGQGIPKAEIEILSGSSVIARGTANDAGEWAIVLTDPLRPGAHDLTVRTKAPSGEMLTSSQSVAVSVPDGGSGEVLVVLNQPGTASTVLQVPGLEEAQKKLREAGVPATPAGQPAAGGETTVAAAPAAQPEAAPAKTGGESFTIGNAPDAAAGGETVVAADTPAEAKPEPAAPAPAVSEPSAPAASAPAPAETAAPAAPAQPAAPAAPETFTIGESPAPAEGGSATAPASPVAEVPVPAEPSPTPAVSAGEGSSATATADAAATPPAVANQETAGSAGSTPVEAPAPAVAPPPVPVTIQAVETENGVLYAAGLAAPGSSIRLYVDDLAKGEAKADADGRWLLEQKLDLAPGSHKVRADHVGPDGSVLTRAEVAFEQAAPVEDQQVAGIGSGSAGVGSGSAGEARVGESETLIIRRGDNLWRIARRLYGRGVRYSTIYEANTDQIRDPNRIYPGQVFVLPKGDTNWQVVQP